MGWNGGEERVDAGAASDDDSVHGHWGARMFKDTHRGYGGYLRVGWGAAGLPLGRYGAYFEGFKEIERRLRPGLWRCLPIGAYFSSGTATGQCIRVRREAGARVCGDGRGLMMVPMHFGTFRLGQ